MKWDPYTPSTRGRINHLAIARRIMKGKPLSPLNDHKSFSIRDDDGRWLTRFAVARFGENTEIGLVVRNICQRNTAGNIAILPSECERLGELTPGAEYSCVYLIDDKLERMSAENLLLSHIMDFMEFDTKCKLNIEWPLVHGVYMIIKAHLPIRACGIPYNMVEDEE